MKRNDLEFYDRHAENWWQPDEKIYALNHLNPARFAFFDRSLSNWQGLKALDVGCGGGFTCEFMAKRGVAVSGLDLSRKCLETARKHAAETGLDIEYKYGFAEQIPWDANTFDAVICVDVLEHVAGVPKVISEIHRVLKPNGFFFFDTINRTFQSKLVMIWLLENLLREIQPGVHDWEKFITPAELIALLHEKGFSDLEIKGFDIFGRTVYQNLLAYLYYQKTKTFRIQIDGDTSIMYIGKAVKAQLN